MTGYMTFRNNGPYLVTSNYWTSDCASKGMLYLSWNAGAARLLVPPCQEGPLVDMRAADHVVVTRGTLFPQRRQAYEMLFEDQSDAPYVVTVCVDQSDRLLPVSEAGRNFRFLVYTEGCLKWETEGRYRVVERLPCCRPWRPE